VKCRACGHHYVDPRVDDEGLESLYDDAYYRGHGFDRGIDFYAEPNAELNGAIADIATMVAGVAGTPISQLNWLDFGCGAGNLLRHVSQSGARAYGYDLGAPARALCAAKGLTLLDDAALREMAGTFDAVSAIEVIEHVTDPLSFLRYLVSLLRVGGVLYVQTGNWNFVRLVRDTPYIMPEGHIHYFNPPTMRRLFETSGLREADVLNVSWIGHRLAKRAPVKISAAVRPLERLVRLVAPGYAQFPVGVRIA
jgi:cyclopropane fatty-acyl-phospholipid synthase-like methyltransferase